MISKLSLQKSHSQFFLITISIIVLILALGVTLWKKSLTARTSPQSSNFTKTFMLSGLVTKKDTSCGVKTLQADGSIKVGPGICDGGNHLTIGDKSIATSSGGPQINGFSVNTDSINPGDEVTVHYTLDEAGYPTLNCESCSIVRTKHTERTESF